MKRWLLTLKSKGWFGSDAKIRLLHCCPLHPEVVEAIAPLFRERPDDEPMFNQLSFERWLKQHKVPLLHGSHHFVLGDLRKFAEQYGDVI